MRWEISNFTIQQLPPKHPGYLPVANPRQEWQPGKAGRFGSEKLGFTGVSPGFVGAESSSCWKKHGMFFLNL